MNIGLSAAISAHALSGSPFNNSDPPISTSWPVVSGVPEVGETLLCAPGTWSGTPTPSFEYQWFRNGLQVLSATSPEYVLEAGDNDALISCRVTAVNSAGTGVGSTVPVMITYPSPLSVTPPIVEGAPVVGQTLSVLPGAWMPAVGAGVELSYQWLRDGALPFRTRSGHRLP